ncbi:MAG: hypothetical protein J1F03_08340 [Oscillospiraceae bacterium]|nr:hypothetical protein [Oscillospiraceae bacterium]
MSEVLERAKSPKENGIMKRIILSFILAAGALGLAGCADGAQEFTEGSSSSSSSDISQSSSFEDSDSSSAAPGGESSEDSFGGSSYEQPGGSKDPLENSQPDESASDIHLSVCPVPAWGVTDRSDLNIFITGSEYDTYRVLQTTEFENGAVKEMRVELYVVSEEFDMDAFKEKWGFEPVWNGTFYEGAANIPEEYAGMTVEEIKLDIAKPLLKKYGSATYDGFPEVILVDPTTAPDPAIEF